MSVEELLSSLTDFMVNCPKPDEQEDIKELIYLLVLEQKNYHPNTVGWNLLQAAIQFVAGS